MFEICFMESVRLKHEFEYPNMDLRVLIYLHIHYLALERCSTQNTMEILAILFEDYGGEKFLDMQTQNLQSFFVYFGP